MFRRTWTPLLPDFTSSEPLDIEHRGGCSWSDAPAPPSKHEHYTWTRGWSRLQEVHRCPCGAIGSTFRGVFRWSLLDKPRVGTRLGVADQQDQIAAGRLKNQEWDETMRYFRQMRDQIQGGSNA